MVEIRAATVSDGIAIRSVHLAAFPTAAEAGLVDRLDRDGDAILSLVAEEGGSIVGHILFSRMQVVGDGKAIDALGLAPVAVVPDRQNQGIGAQLIETGLSAVRDGGTDLVFLVGEPAYYGRFGFRADAAAPFTSPYAGEYFQAKLLSDEGQVPAAGRADYAPAFADLA